jgi:integrase
MGKKREQTMNGKTRLRNGQIVKAGNVPGFYARKRGGRTVWLLRYSAHGVQRELIFGNLSSDGIMGKLAGALALEGIGQQPDFAAALIASKGAREPIPPQYAEPIARRLRTMLEAGRDLVSELRQRRDEAAVEAREREDRSVEAVADRWVRRLQQQGKRTAIEVGNVLRRHVHPLIGAKDIGRVTRADAHRVYDVLAERGQAPTGAQVTRLLKALLSFAVDRGLIAANPLLRIKIATALEPRERILIRFHPERAPDASELWAVWAATSALAPVQAACIRTLLLTGQRRGEVQRMTWGELDGSLWTIPPERHKGKKEHTVPLSTRAHEIILAMAAPEDRRPDRFVFRGRGGRPIGDFSAIKAQLDASSGVTDWTLHDLRRTAASWMQEAGFNASEVLGHAVPALVATYQRGPGYARKRAALAAWANFVHGVDVDVKVVPLRGA